MNTTPFYYPNNPMPLSPSPPMSQDSEDIGLPVSDSPNPSRSMSLQRKVKLNPVSKYQPKQKTPSATPQAQQRENTSLPLQLPSLDLPEEEQGLFTLISQPEKSLIQQTEPTTTISVAPLVSQPPQPQPPPGFTEPSQSRKVVSPSAQRQPPQTRQVVSPRSQRPPVERSERSERGVQGGQGGQGERGGRGQGRGQYHPRGNPPGRREFRSSYIANPITEPVVSILQSPRTMGTIGLPVGTNPTLLKQEKLVVPGKLPIKFISSSTKEQPTRPTGFKSTTSTTTTTRQSPRLRTPTPKTQREVIQEINPIPYTREQEQIVRSIDITKLNPGKTTKGNLSYSVTELKEFARSLSLKITGTKAELTERIKSFLDTHVSINPLEEEEVEEEVEEEEEEEEEVEVEVEEEEEEEEEEIGEEEKIEEELGKKK